MKITLEIDNQDLRSLRKIAGVLGICAIDESDPAAWHYFLLPLAAFLSNNFHNSFPNNPQVVSDDRWLSCNLA